MRITSSSYLVALALLTACTVPDVTFSKQGSDAGAGNGGGDAGGGSGGGPDREVLVEWPLRHLATGAGLNCPQASDIARVTSLPWNPATQQPRGAAFHDDFDCTDGSGLITLPDNFYLVSVAILSPTEQLLASSSVAIVDTTVGDDAADATVFDDAGHVTLSWDVLNKATQARLACADVGLSGADTVELVSTNMADPSKPLVDRYFCDDHFGTSRPLLPGHYTLSITASRGGAAFGDPVMFGDVQIMSSGVTDLGNVKLKVPVP
ncbi:MAG TPA: hypothetical protein VFT22_08225 [Kofleriaceae bacterium]|nr:hypothetical protein [Kofleriaceae bacterium]